MADHRNRRGRDPAGGVLQGRLRAAHRALLLREEGRDAELGADASRAPLASLAHFLASGLNGAVRSKSMKLEPAASCGLSPGTNDTSRASGSVIMSLR